MKDFFHGLLETLRFALISLLMHDQLDDQQRSRADVKHYQQLGAALIISVLLLAVCVGKFLAQ